MQSSPAPMLIVQCIVSDERANGCFSLTHVWVAQAGNVDAINIANPIDMVKKLRITPKSPFTGKGFSKNVLKSLCAINSNFNYHPLQDYRLLPRRDESSALTAGPVCLLLWRPADTRSAP